MAKHTINGFLVWEKYEWEQNASIAFNKYQPKGGADGDEYSQRVTVRPHSIEVEIADDFNPVPQQVASLEAAKKQAQLECAQKLMQLDEQISKLQAITYDVEAA